MPYSISRQEGTTGYRVTVDGEEIIEQWSPHPFRQKEGFRKFKGGKTYRITYEHFDGGSDQQAMFRYADYLNDPEFTEAVSEADAVIVCVGYDWYVESESWDRSFSLPEGHLECIEAVLKHTDKAIVVINSGGGVEMTPWIDRTSGVMMAWYQGQEGGDAIAELITGKVSPSGKLPFTIEKRLEDNPTYENYHPNTLQVKPDNPYKRVEYNEGVFVGYRGYERSGTEPLFPVRVRTVLFIVRVRQSRNRPNRKRQILRDVRRDQHRKGGTLRKWHSCMSVRKTRQWCVRRRNSRVTKRSS